MSLQFAAGVTNVHPCGKSILNMFAGDPVTAVVVTVIGNEFVPLVSMTPGAVTVAERVAAVAGKTPKAMITVVIDRAAKA